MAKNHGTTGVEVYRECAARGMTVAETARHLGKTKETVYWMKYHHNIPFPLKQNPPKPAQMWHTLHFKVDAEQHDEIRAFVEKYGKTQAEALRLLLEWGLEAAENYK